MAKQSLNILLWFVLVLQSSKSMLTAKNNKFTELSTLKNSWRNASNDDLSVRDNIVRNSSLIRLGSVTFRIPFEVVHDQQNKSDAMLSIATNQGIFEVRGMLENNADEKLSSADENSFPADENLTLRNEMSSRSSRSMSFYPEIPDDKGIKIKDPKHKRVMMFVKSLVEDAPWEQLFMRMVRMVVDEFVDKILAHMFANKNKEKRSIDLVYRVPYPVESWNSQGEDSDQMSTESQSYDSSFGKTIAGVALDSFLKAFVEDGHESKDQEDEFFNLNSVEHGKPKTNHNEKEVSWTKVIDFLQQQVPNRQKRSAVEDLPKQEKSILISLVHAMKKAFEDRNSESVRYLIETVNRHVRNRRSTDRWIDNKVLWSDDDAKPPNRRIKDDCSLRNACNAGRLLSRLPSVHDLTMQLKGPGHQPHWDALLWGMQKKKCSKIRCRGPKGSKKYHRRKLFQNIFENRLDKNKEYL